MTIPVMPTTGGSWIRDPATGTLTRADAAVPEASSAPPAPPEAAAPAKSRSKKEA